MDGDIEHVVKHKHISVGARIDTNVDCRLHHGYGNQNKIIVSVHVGVNISCLDEGLRVHSHTHMSAPD